MQRSAMRGEPEPNVGRALPDMVGKAHGYYINQRESGLMFLFAPFGHGIARQLHAFFPEVIGQPGLAPEHGEKLARLREVFPDLRQKSAAIRAILEHYTVHAGA